MALGDRNIPQAPPDAGDNSLVSAAGAIYFPYPKVGEPNPPSLMSKFKDTSSAVPVGGVLTNGDLSFGPQNPLLVTGDKGGTTAQGREIAWNNTIGRVLNSGGN
jgi:hypothetical protein